MYHVFNWKTGGTSNYDMHHYTYTSWVTQRLPICSINLVSICHFLSCSPTAPLHKIKWMQFPIVRPLRCSSGRTFQLGQLHKGLPSPLIHLPLTAQRRCQDHFKQLLIHSLGSRKCSLKTSTNVAPSTSVNNLLIACSTQHFSLPLPLLLYSLSLLLFLEFGQGNLLFHNAFCGHFVFMPLSIVILLAKYLRIRLMWRHLLSFVLHLDIGQKSH